MKFFFAITVLVSLLASLLGRADGAVDCSYRRPGCYWLTIYQPVCGNNGCTYGNAGEASCANAGVAYQGECLRQPIPRVY